MDERCDVAVVGAGLGGLASAVCLARAGLSVRVFERQDSPGGLATTFHRDPYRFDASLHLLDAVGEGQPNRALLDDLGVSSHLRFVQDRWSQRNCWPDLDLWLPQRADGWLETLRDAFPAEGSGLLRLMTLALDTQAALYENLTRWWDGGSLREFPAAMRPLLRRTAADVIAEHVSAPRAREVVGHSTVYLGLPAHRMAALTWLLLTAGYHGCGGWYLEGGGAALVKALVASLEQRGGHLETGNAVSQVLLKQGQIAGVQLEDGRRVAAPVVVHNAPPAILTGSLLHRDWLPRRWSSRLESLELSVSAVKVWFGLDADVTHFGPHAYETMYRDPGLPDWARDGIAVALPSLLDPSCCPAGHGVVTVIATVPAATGEEQSSAYDGAGEQMLAALDARLLPGLSRHVQVLERATPRTFQRATGTPGGAIFGFAHTPSQVGPRRPDTRTPLEGLYLASGWANPGAGYTSSLIAGRNAAQQILETQP